MYKIGTKLGVNRLFYTHVGLYIGNGQVFHNHWRNDSEIISLQQFANGNEVEVLDQGVQSPHEFINRVRQVLASRKPYHPLNNNCEHTASYVGTGIASSPQIAFYGLMFLIGSGYLLWQKTRS